ncbi:hypothetical protein [Streptomyces sp. BBFR102]|uniref:hypothetical protein n=1 Tax=Streptomyces sp. BBFR102 TaxID=3448171 RepID=UPI003F53B8D0
MVRSAGRVLAGLPEGAPEAVRARLLAPVAVEPRGDALAEGALPHAADPPAPEPWRRRVEQAATLAGAPRLAARAATELARPTADRRARHAGC